MVVVVVKWSVKPDTIQALRRFWSQEAPAHDRLGLVAEFLSEVGSKDDYPYVTWTLSTI